MHRPKHLRAILIAGGIVLLLAILWLLGWLMGMGWFLVPALILMGLEANAALAYRLPWLYGIFMVALIALVVFLFRRHKARLAIGVILLVPILLGFGLPVYNSTFGKSCTADDQCRFVCGEGALGPIGIEWSDPFIHVDCFGGYGAVCENLRCQTVRYDESTPTETCNRMQPEDKGACLYFRALASNDSSLCSMIPKPDSQYWCLSEFGLPAPSADFCLRLKEEYARKSCLGPLARAGTDVKLCHLTYVNDKDAALYHWNATCYAGVAARLGNIHLCEELSEAETKFCWYELAHIVAESGNASLCDEQGDGAMGCYIVAWQWGVGLDFCKTSTNKDQCYADVASAGEDYNRFCPLIDDQEQQDFCFSEAAHVTGRDSFCDKAGAHDSGCWAGLAQDRRNPVGCQAINASDPYGKAWCYQGLAIQLNDASICNKIPERSAAQLCSESDAVHATAWHCLTLVETGNTMRQECVNYVALPIG